jgi:hypothetical protein
MNQENKAIKKLLELKGYKPEEIKAILEINNSSEKKKNKQEFRSWIGIITSIIALIVSILVAIFK